MTNNILGIDIGGSAVHVVSLNKGKIKCLFSFENELFFKNKKLLDKAIEKSEIIALTGGGINKLKIKTGKPTMLIDEIKAIGTGGSVSSGKKNAFVVSMGTGTAMVAVNKNKILHAGGTGLGGGTLKGLADLVLKNNSLDKLEYFAKKGDLKKIDLKVFDIVGKVIGKLPSSATASNLGKLKSKEKKDLALGFFNMIAEVVGTLAFFSAKNYGLENNIIFCGRVAKNNIISRKIKETVSMWGGKSYIPDNPEYCTASGAAICCQNLKG